MNVEKYENRSLARTKTTFKNILDSVLREVFSTVPLGGIGYDWIKVLIGHAMQYRNDQNQERIEKFHQAIFCGANAEETERILECEFSMKEYTQLLSHVIQEDEDEKVDVYARLFKALQSNTIPTKYRNHFLRLSKELHIDDIEFMRKVFIYSNFKLKENGDIRRQMEGLTNTQDPIINISVQNLVRMGYLYEKSGTKPNYPTDMLATFINVVYYPDELAPEAIGKQIWNDISVTIACENLDKHSTLLLKISNAFLHENIKTVISVPSHVQFTAQIIVLLQEGALSENSMKMITEKVKFGITVLKLFLPSGSVFHDETNSFYLKSYDNDQEIKKFVKWVASKIEIIN